MKNLRCGICNTVSSRDIETNFDEHYLGHFIPDPKNKLFFLCLPCKETIEELLVDYEVQDDMYGWENHRELDEDTIVVIDQMSYHDEYLEEFGEFNDQAETREG